MAFGKGGSRILDVFPSFHASKLMKREVEGEGGHNLDGGKQPETFAHKSLHSSVLFSCPPPNAISGSGHSSIHTRISFWLFWLVWLSGPVVLTVIVGTKVDTRITIKRGISSFSSLSR